MKFCWQMNLENLRKMLTNNSQYLYFKIKQRMLKSSTIHCKIKKKQKFLNQDQVLKLVI